MTESTPTVSSANVVLHPSFEKMEQRNEYIDSNKAFISDFSGYQTYDEGSHDVIMNILTGRPDRLEFIELEDSFREYGHNSAKNELFDRGEIKIRDFLLQWEIVCLDKNYMILEEPIGKKALIHKRRLKLSRLFAPQVHKIYQQAK